MGKEDKYPESAAEQEDDDDDDDKTAISFHRAVFIVCNLRRLIKRPKKDSYNNNNNNSNANSTNNLNTNTLTDSNLNSNNSNNEKLSHDLKRNYDKHHHHHHHKHHANDSTKDCDECRQFGAADSLTLNAFDAALSRGRGDTNQSRLGAGGLLTSGSLSSYTRILEVVAEHARRCPRRALSIPSSISLLPRPFQTYSDRNEPTAVSKLASLTLSATLTRDQTLVQIAASLPAGVTNRLTSSYLNATPSKCIQALQAVAACHATPCSDIDQVGVKAPKAEGHLVLVWPSMFTNYSSVSVSPLIQQQQPHQNNLLDPTNVRQDLQTSRRRASDECLATTNDATKCANEQLGSMLNTKKRLSAETVDYVTSKFASNTSLSGRDLSDNDERCEKYNYNYDNDNYDQCASQKQFPMQQQKLSPSKIKRKKQIKIATPTSKLKRFNSALSVFEQQQTSKQLQASQLKLIQQPTTSNNKQDTGNNKSYVKQPTNTLTLTTTNNASIFEHLTPTRSHNKFRSNKKSSVITQPAIVMRQLSQSGFEEALFNAVECNNFERVRTILTSGKADINCLNNFKLTCLDIAALSHNKHMVHLLQHFNGRESSADMTADERRHQLYVVYIEAKRRVAELSRAVSAMIGVGLSSAMAISGSSVTSSPQSTFASESSLLTCPTTTTSTPNSTAGHVSSGMLFEQKHRNLQHCSKRVDFLMDLRYMFELLDVPRGAPELATLEIASESSLRVKILQTKPHSGLDDLIGRANLLSALSTAAKPSLEDKKSTQSARQSTARKVTSAASIEAAVAAVASLSSVKLQATNDVITPLTASASLSDKLNNFNRILAMQLVADTNECYNKKQLIQRQKSEDSALNSSRSSCKLLQRDVDKQQVNSISCHLLALRTKLLDLELGEKNNKQQHNQIVTKFKVEWKTSKDSKQIIGSLIVYVGKSSLIECCIDKLTSYRTYYVTVSAGNHKGFGEPLATWPPSLAPSSWRQAQSSSLTTTINSANSRRGHRYDEQVLRKLAKLVQLNKQVFASSALLQSIIASSPEYRLQPLQRHMGSSIRGSNFKLRNNSSNKQRNKHQHQQQKKLASAIVESSAAAALIDPLLSSQSGLLPCQRPSYVPSCELVDEKMSKISRNSLTSNNGSKNYDDNDNESSSPSLSSLLISSVANDTPRNVANSAGLNVRRNIKSFFQMSSSSAKFQKLNNSNKRGVYLCTVIYSSDPSIPSNTSVAPSGILKQQLLPSQERVIVTNDERLPIVEVLNDVVSQATLCQDYPWLVKLSATKWTDIKLLRHQMQKAHLSNASLLLKIKLLAAIEQMQTALGMQDIGRLYYKPLVSPSDGSMLVCTVKQQPQSLCNKFTSNLAVKWTSCSKISPRHIRKISDSMLQQQQQLAEQTTLGNCTILPASTINLQCQPPDKSINRKQSANSTASTSATHLSAGTALPGSSLITSLAAPVEQTANELSLCDSCKPHMARRCTYVGAPTSSLQASFGGNLNSGSGSGSASGSVSGSGSGIGSGTGNSDSHTSPSGNSRLMSLTAGSKQCTCGLNLSSKLVAQLCAPTALSLYDLLLVSLVEMFDFESNSRRKLPRGLYLGFVQLQTTVDSMKLLVPRSLPNVVPFIKIRDNSHVSRDEWQFVNEVDSFSSTCQSVGQNNIVKISASKTASSSTSNTQHWSTGDSTSLGALSKVRQFVATSSDELSISSSCQGSKNNTCSTRQQENSSVGQQLFSSEPELINSATKQTLTDYQSDSFRRRAKSMAPSPANCICENSQPINAKVAAASAERLNISTAGSSNFECLEKENITSSQSTSLHLQHKQLHLAHEETLARQISEASRKLIANLQSKIAKTFEPKTKSWQSLFNSLNEPSSNRIYSLDIVNLSSDIAFILLIPTPKNVCLVTSSSCISLSNNMMYNGDNGQVGFGSCNDSTAFDNHQTNSDNNSNAKDFLLMPLQVFETIHINTYNGELLSRYAQISTALDAELYVAQHEHRQAFSSNELKTTKSRLQVLQDMVVAADEFWRQLRWIVDVVSFARDKSAASSKICTRLASLWRHFDYLSVTTSLKTPNDLSLLATINNLGFANSSTSPVLSNCSSTRLNTTAATTTLLSQQHQLWHQSQASVATANSSLGAYDVLPSQHRRSISSLSTATTATTTTTTGDDASVSSSAVSTVTTSTVGLANHNQSANNYSSNFNLSRSVPSQFSSSKTKDKEEFIRVPVTTKIVIHCEDDSRNEHENSDDDAITVNDEDPEDDAIYKYHVSLRNARHMARKGSQQSTRPIVADLELLTEAANLEQQSKQADSEFNLLKQDVVTQHQPMSRPKSALTNPFLAMSDSSFDIVMMASRKESPNASKTHSNEFNEDIFTLNDTTYAKNTTSSSLSQTTTQTNYNQPKDFEDDSSGDILI